MKKGARNITITAVVAIATFLLVALFFAGMRNTKQVVVAAHALAPGTRITAGDVRVKKVHAADCLPGALSKPSAVVGKVVAFARAGGDQITANMVGTGTYGISAQLPPDERAIAIQVTKAEGLAGIVRPGDRVTAIAIIDPQQLDMVNMQGYATMQPPQPGASGKKSASAQVVVTGLSPTARVVLTGLKVLMVPDSFRYVEHSNKSSLSPVRSSGNSGVILLEAPITPISMTLSVSNGVTNTMMISPVELLALLNEKGKIHLAMEPVTGSHEVSVGVSMGNMLNFAVEAPPILPSPTPTMTPTPFFGKGKAKATPTPKAQKGGKTP